ncbi:phosphate ABC transporter permease [Leptolyngbya sp. 'hensonii']|uniref:ABC transporter permease n=1 Tax=Leptolyngbya sp. 'hensonii' TaxID=1922337 RepID=UPI00094FFA90|nr:ABC transporter permease [Leptolyngbya sp. 'hensonii']OLP18616.1 phosphate ABC transporter permease [Leptolyngbya sp. 'hensonii']
MKQARSTLVIEPGYINRRYLRDLWRQRELLLFLGWRDIMVRYKQTAVGMAWVMIRPLVTMVAFTLVFGKLAGLEARSPGVPYPLLVFSAMLPWQLFADAVGRISVSLVSNAHIISKVYFPRLIIPLSALFVCLIDFLVAGLILLAMMVIYHVVPGWQMLALPLLVLLVGATALALGLWLAALSTRYRDLTQLTPLILQFGLYVSPVGFSSAIVPEQWRWLYGLNPLVGAIEGFRWAILGQPMLVYWPSVGVSLALVLLVLLSGLWYLRRIERSLIDVI